MAKVSISGYYKHKKLIISKDTKEDRESIDLEVVKGLCSKYNQKYGYRIITMVLRGKGVIFNHKKVLRLMKKYDLLSKVRKRNPYKQIAKATQEHRSLKNLLNRDFSGITPLKKLGTDISYLYYNSTKAYISILKDMITGEILSHKVSGNIGLGFVLETIEGAKLNKSSGVIIQSDQGFHYTHPMYQKLLKDKGVIQSMSRKGNCLDNAPTESFFGHLKDEIDISSCRSLEELEKYIESYIFHYNNERPQWSRKKMTPVQYRNHLLQI